LYNPRKDSRSLNRRLSHEDTLTLELIRDSVDALAGLIRRTPLEYSPSLSERYGVPIHFKLEFLQTTGSFKLRGAYFKLLRLLEEQQKNGVATCSAGNHGWALAFAGRELKIPVTVFLPASVDPSKRDGIQSLGATTVVTEFPGYDETEEFAILESSRLGLPFVSAYDDPAVMAANGGSLAVEILEERPETTNFIFPVGGGGLGAGLSYWVKRANSGSFLIGCQHEGSPALKLSLEKGEAVTRLPAIETVAGGIEGGIGAVSFPYLQGTVDEVVLLSEEEIKAGVRWMLEHHHYLIEPSSAVVAAALIGSRVKQLTGLTVAILTGRNVAIETLSNILEEDH
jgi:threonine dehydratase